MENLYNRLYKAINEGISKTMRTFIIDDDTNNDQSITYQHNALTNNFNSLEPYVKVFLSDDLEQSFNAYNEIINVYTADNIKYPVKSFEELKDMLIKLQQVENEYSGHPHNMKMNFEWIDFEANNILTIQGILKDGSYISYKELNKLREAKVSISLNYMQIESQVLDHPIIIGNNVKKDMPLISYYLPKYRFTAHPDYINDIHGYENTQDLINGMKTVNGKIEKTAPALDWIMKLSNDIVTAYLPSAQEMQFLADLMPLINYLLSYIAYWKIVTGSKYYTSTIYEHKSIYSLKLCVYTFTNNGTSQASLEENKNDLKYRALPLYKKIKA